MGVEGSAGNHLVKIHWAFPVGPVLWASTRQPLSSSISLELNTTADNLTLVEGHGRRAHVTQHHGKPLCSSCKADGTSLIYIDRHLVHEVHISNLKTWSTSPSTICSKVTSPQAFEGLRLSNREAPWWIWEKSQNLRIPSNFFWPCQVRRTDCTLATVDHNIPTSSRKNFKERGFCGWKHLLVKQQITWTLPWFWGSCFMMFHLWVKSAMILGRWW